jgi:carboxyl-terminal processing protease
LTAILPGLLMVLLLSIGMSTTARGSNSVIGEIRTALVHRSFYNPSAEQVSALKMKSLNAGLLAIDPYARYIPPVGPGRDKPAVHLGLGLFLFQSNVWVQTEPGGPAEKAGVPGVGRLLAVNGLPVHNNALLKTSELIDSAIHSKRVDLTVASPGGSGKSYVVRPAEFAGRSITWRSVAGIRMVRINEFMAHVTAPTLAALYQTATPAGSPIVIDLRHCSGGDLFEAMDTAGLYVPPGRVLVVTSNRTGATKAYRSPGTRKFRSPTAILIDRDTASAAEIFAGVLQFYKLSRIIGDKSFGKCMSQTLILLSNGGTLWLTTLSVYFPDFSSCTKKGIEPDVLIPKIMVKSYKEVVEIIRQEGLLSPNRNK